MGAGPRKHMDILGLAMNDGADLCVHPSGKAVVSISCQPQGQGHETTFAQIVAEADEPALTGQAAVAFADQDKAFERLSLDWFARILDGWRLPTWARRGLLALAANRTVVAASAPRAPTRLLRRSLGMGGTSSPLAWCMAYDPIVAGLRAAVGAPAPTYVDDLAGLLRGARQALRAAYYLLFASWAAGLEVTPHHCRRLRVPDTSRARSACLALPVQTRRSCPGTVDISGIQAPLLRAMLMQRQVPGAAEAEDIRVPCTCSLKTALVPASRHHFWRQVMEASPFGAAAVKQVWPYLGAAVARACGRVAAPGAPRARRARW